MTDKSEEDIGWCIMGACQEFFVGGDGIIEKYLVIQGKKDTFVLNDLSAKG